MYVYRIVHQQARTKDLSGTGAYRTGGRWNSKGIYMLYTSANSSLALLETLVHLDISVLPPHMYLMQIQIDDTAPIFIPADGNYPVDWKQPGGLATKSIGDKWMTASTHVAIRVRSAVNETEFNYLLNPAFVDYSKMVKIETVREISLDGRLV